MEENATIEDLSAADGDRSLDGQDVVDQCLDTA
jgi:hypothetical protein